MPWRWTPGAAIAKRPPAPASSGQIARRVVRGRVFRRRHPQRPSILASSRAWSVIASWAESIICPLVSGGFHRRLALGLIRRSGLSSGEITADHLAGPIAHLRRYSNYLTRATACSAPTPWAAVANLIRNLILNQSPADLLPGRPARPAPAGRRARHGGAQHGGDAVCPDRLRASGGRLDGHRHRPAAHRRARSRSRQALRAYFGVACGLAATVLIAAAVGRSAMADVAPARLGFTLACLYFFSWTLGWLLATPLASSGREKRPDSTATLGARLSKLAWFFVAP